MTEKLFLTHKRKKWKFAHFAKWPNCLEASEVTPSVWSRYFSHAGPLTVEIGAGTASLTIDLARLYPKRQFVAVDVKADRLYAGAKLALQEDLAHVAFVRAQLRRMDELFAPHAIHELWLTFPDPFPRVKQAKHRLTHPNFLAVYQRLLKPGGVLRFKTDDQSLFLWSLEQFVDAGWRLSEFTFDLHASGLPTDYKLTTAYERRFMAEGKRINYVSVLPPQS